MPTKIKLGTNITLPAPEETGTGRANKLKISLNKPKKPTAANSKRKQAKGIVNRVGILPLRFIKITSLEEKKIDISSVPFSKNVQIIKANQRSFTLKIKVPKKEQG